MDSNDKRVVVQVRGLTKVYEMGQTEVHALRGVDLELLRSELVVILGPSGSGKSTLLNIMGGLDAPTEGTLIYEGKRLEADDDKALTEFRRKHVGFVFQFYNLIPSLTAKENVELVTEIAPGSMSAAQALEWVGLGDRLDSFPSQLSGGQQQRVAIARAIAKRPALLLCDEPTGALDVSTGRIVLEVLARVNEELGSTTAIITHNAAIGKMAHRIVTFGDGHVSDIEENAHRIPASEVSW